MNIKPSLQRLAITVAATSAAMTGVAGFAIITQPASTSAPDMTREVTYVDPAADEATTTTTFTVPAEVTEEADRAEVAAGRAEVAAGRAEVAATKAETVVTSTTSTTAGVSATQAPTTTTSRPIFVGVTETTTSTVTVPKQWVEIARIPALPKSTDYGPPIRIPVSLETGKLRVTGPVLQAGGAFPQTRPGVVAVWLGSEETPSVANPPTADNTGSTISWTEPGNRPSGTTPWSGPWPTGDQTISVGQLRYEGGWVAPYWTDSDLIIEEYR